MALVRQQRCTVYHTMISGSLSGQYRIATGWRAGIAPKKSRLMAAYFIHNSNQSPHSPAASSSFFFTPFQLNRTDSVLRAISSPSPLPARLRKAYPSNVRRPSSQPHQAATEQGIRTINVVPCSDDCTSIVPRCASTMHRQVYRPSPMPAAPPRWSGRFARVSGSNRVGNAEGGMGLPWL